MKVTLAIAVATSVLLSGCREATAPAPDYRPGEAGTVDHAMCLLGFSAVPLREITTGHHLVQASINGRRGYFVLDTGANVTVVDRAWRERFGIAATPFTSGDAIGVGGGGSASQARIDSFRIEEVPIRNRRIVTAELGQLLQSLGRVSGETVYGIVGQDVLNEHRAIIDVARPMLYLMEEDRDPAPVPAERCRGDAANDAVPAA